MTLDQVAPRGSRLSLLIGFAIVATLLRVGDEVLIPIALAVMLAFLLSPIVTRLTRWRFPNAAAVLLTGTLGFGVLGSVGWLVSNQVMGLVEELPNYEENIRRKLAVLKQQDGGGVSRTTGMVKKLRAEMEGEARAPSSEAATPAPVPVPVEVKEAAPTSLELARQIVGPLLGPLASAALVVLLVLAMLFQRHDLRERFIKSISYGRINLATEAVDDATRRISRYLTMQLLVNATYGLPIGIALYFIGVPNAALWGLLATLLRFIPFLGPWIAAIFPIVLAIAVDPGWSMVAWTLAVFLVAELISNNLVEPWLYGASTGISTVALIIAAVFWTWLWGPAGLFLSTPLTVCLFVVGKHAPGFEFLSVLLGSERALEPPAQFYQRMLAMDAEALLELATSYVAEHDLAAFYDDMFAPALILAEEDRHRGALAEVRLRFILQSSRDVIEELERRSEAEPRAAAPIDAPVSAKSLRPGSTAPVLGVAARDDADELVGLMLVHLLRLQGVRAQICPITTASADCINRASAHEVKVAFVSALPPSALTSARRVTHRLRESCPGTRVVVGVWSGSADPVKLAADLTTVGAHAVATRLSVAATLIVAQLEETAADGFLPAPHRDNEAERLAAVQASGLLDTGSEELFESTSREIAEAFAVPISLVTVVDAERQFWKGQTGLPQDLAEAHESPRETSICGHVVATGKMLVVEDTRKDRRFAANPFLLDRGIRFYAGVPLFSGNGLPIGSLCVIDTKPRIITAEEKEFLQHAAERLMQRMKTARTGGQPASCIATHASVGPQP